MAYTTIDDPTAYFKIQLYTGTGSSNAQTFADTDTDMQPNMVWIKSRSDAFNHMLYDSVRGVHIHLKPDGTNAEATDSNALTAFGSDGFTVGTNTDLNNSSDTYVAWCWKESATAGFDIVLYTGNGTDDTDISHSLSAVPDVMFAKKRSGTSNWNTYHKYVSSDPETDYLSLDNTDQIYDSAGYWSDEEPTSSVFTLGDGATNTSSQTFVNYLFTSIKGYSKHGHFFGNGNADGGFCYLGFRPAFVMVKRVNGTGPWIVFDNKRAGYNVSNYMLFAERTSNEDAGSTERIDLLSNGFKMRNSDVDHNGAESYVYLAFAEAPFVNSNGVPCNAR